MRLTDGNLSRHIDVLEEAGLIEVQKGFEKKRPQTICKLTDDGRKRFLGYLEELERVIHDALSRGSEAGAKSSTVSLGWGRA